MARKSSAKKAPAAEAGPAPALAGSAVLLRDVRGVGKKGAIVQFDGDALAEALGNGGARRATLRDFQLAGLAPKGFGLPGGGE